MRSDKIAKFVETYLYRAQGHRALQQSVFAEGERRGYSERKLCRAAQMLGIDITENCWELPALRAEALDARSLLALDSQRVVSQPLALSGAAFNGRVRRNAA